MSFVKFDMHCHTAEGSMDAHISIREYVEVLKSKGFGGMLVTDHDSYEGYLAYKRESGCDKSFTVLRGIEYDTSDFGHILVIMPRNFVPDVLAMRGLALKRLIRIVHYFGGILGPAHPCGERFLSFCSTGAFKEIEKAALMRKFDFVEGFNACEPEENNQGAQALAAAYGKLMTAGSDAHCKNCVGLAYTELPKEIQTEDDLIAYMKQAPALSIGGSRYTKTTKDKLGALNKALVYSFFFYNKLGALYRLPARRRAFGRIAYEMEGNK